MNTIFDYETQSFYQIQVKVSDGEFEITGNLTVYITDVNEPPTFSFSQQQGPVYEDEVTPRVILLVKFSDPEGDILTYTLSDIIPNSADFTVNNLNGECYFIFLPTVHSGEDFVVF